MSTNSREYYREYYKKNIDHLRELGRESTRRYRARHKERIAKERAANRDKHSARGKMYYRAHKEESRIRSRKSKLRRFGLTPEKFEEMKKDQDGKCGICREEKQLHIDHDHATGIVRGLLCMRCNTSLEFYEKHQVAAKKYLQRRR